MNDSEVLERIASETYQLSVALSRYLDFIVTICGVDPRVPIEPFADDGFVREKKIEVGKGKTL